MMAHPFNPDMLVLAREMRGLKQSELAQRINVSQGTVSKYEGGVQTPSVDDIERLATTLGFPVPFFFRKGQRYGVETGAIFHRKRVRASSIDTKRIDSYVNLHRINSAEVLANLDVASPYEIPQLGLKDYGGDPEIVAGVVREIWQLPSGPIDHLIRRLEAASCLVFAIDFGTEDIDENVQWIPPEPPILLVNTRAPGDRLRFSLAHALGHLVMHHGDAISNKKEEEADRFASAFLMPEIDLRDDILPVTVERMLQLKPYWKVSMQALIKRAHDIEEISNTRYRSLFQQLSRKGYRKNEPVQIATEKPKRFEEILDLYRQHLEYQDADFAKWFAINLDDFYHLYYPQRPKLRLI